MKKGKSIVINCTKVICFLMVLILCTNYISGILKDKDNYLKYASFYSEKEQFDALFFGSSRMLDGIYPMELWEEFGITSYNMAQHSEDLIISYWQMKNAFEYNAPKIAVVDVSVFYLGKVQGDDDSAKSYLHKSLDHMPLTYWKYAALKDVTENVNIFEYLFPLTIYHNRWNELERNDFYKEPYGLKGAELRFGVEPLPNDGWCSDEIATDFDVSAVKMDAMIELCEEYDVQLIFSCMPSVYTSCDPNVASIMNYIEQYAKEEGVPFLNFAKDSDIINYSTDFADRAHLNPSGAGKVTCEIGKYLIENYALDGQKDTKTIDSWNQSLEIYKDIKLAKLQELEDADQLINYLMFLNDDDYYIEMEMYDLGYIQTKGIADLLSEIEIQPDDIQVGTTEGHVVITVYDRDNMEKVDVAVFNN